MTEEEFNETVKSNFQSLVKAAESVLGCEEAAKDAVQQTLIRVWKNISTFDPEKGTIEALLHVSAKRAALDQLRSRKRRLATMERFWGEIIVQGRPKAPDPRIESLMKAFSNMPEKKRLLLQKHYLEGKSATDISNEMGLSLCATKSKILRFRGSLLQEFRKKEYKSRIDAKIN
jgi:RNA polymerase sigma-70 factor (ECF subfamily)